MASLKNIVDADIFDVLIQHKIFSVDDFLMADLDKVASITGLRAADVLELKHKMNHCFLPKMIPGDEYYRKKLKNCSVIQTGISGLDTILDGGLRMGTLLEICGMPGCGKTQLCLNIAINLASKYKIDVLYADTSGNLVASHVASLIDGLGLQENSDDILESIKVTKIKNTYSLISMLHSLNDIDKTYKKLKAIIIDSIATLYFPFIGSKNLDGNHGISLLSHVALMLKFLATQHNLVVILVNLASQWGQRDGCEVGDDDGRKQAGGPTDREVPSIKPCMGKFWAHIPNTRLLLSANQHGRTLSIHKSEYLPKDKIEIIQISEDGVIK